MGRFAMARLAKCLEAEREATSRRESGDLLKMDGHERKRGFYSMKKLLTLVMALVMVMTMAAFAAAETVAADEQEDVIAVMPEAGWVLDGVDGAIWQDDRASLEIFLEDVDNFKVQITWASSATETTEWVYACDYDAEADVLKARYAICDSVIYDEAGEENRTPVYEKDSSEAVFSLNAEGQVVLTNAGDEALEGKVFTYTGNLEEDAQ